MSSLKFGVISSFVIATSLLLAFQNCSGFQSLALRVANGGSEGAGRFTIAQGQVSGTKFGIKYDVWHCLTGGSNFDMHLALTGKAGWGPVPSFHWRAAPTLGYYCALNDRSVFRTHAAQLRDAGIDFVAVDISNFPDNSGQAIAGASQPFQALLEEWSKIPGAPKVVPWTPFTAGATMPAAIDAILSQFPDMQFIFKGKPLFLVVNNPALAPDAQMVASFASKYTIRGMWALVPAGSQSWSFMQPCQDGFKASGGNIPCNQNVALGPDGQVEQISVATAYQYTIMSDTTTAVPKFHGLTFQAQMRTVDNYANPPIVFVTGWNEWIAQRFCYLRGVNTTDCAAGSETLPNGNRVFVDLYDEEYNRDFEPDTIQGDVYYQQLKGEILGRKVVGSQVVGQIDAVSVSGKQVLIGGWACATGVSSSIDVHAYVNGAAGSQGASIVAAAAANQPSEPGVNSSCLDNLPAHRFTITVDQASAHAHAGQGIWVHGISPGKNGNLALTNSGRFQMPDPGAPPVTATPAPTPAPSQPAPSQPAQSSPGLVPTGIIKVPIYRFYSSGNSMHFMTATYLEGANAQMTPEGQPFSMIGNLGLPNTMPIYRCANLPAHFFSSHSNCEGQTVEGMIGSLFVTEVSGSLPVYRLFNPVSFDRIQSTNPNEGSPAYVNEGIIGFALP